MPIDLEITMKLSKQLAEQASREFHAGEKKRIKQTATDAEVAEKAKTAIVARETKQRIDALVRAHKTAIDLANDQAKAEKAAAKEAAKAQAEAAREAARQARDAARQQMAAAREAARSATQESKDAAKAQMAAAREALKAARDATREAARAARDAMRDQTQAEREAAREKVKEERAATQEMTKLDRDWKARLKQNAREVKDENKLHAAEGKEVLKEYQGLWNEQSASTSSAVQAVGTFGAAMVGLGSVAAVVGEIDGSFQRTRDTIYTSVNLLHDFQETLLELAALKDHAGDATGETIETLRFQAKTGQKVDDARALQTEFLGSAESVVGPGKKLAQDQADLAMVGIGRIAATHAGSAGAWGDLGGTLAQTMKPKDGKSLTGAELASEVAATYSLTRPAKFGTIDEFTSQYAKIQGAVQNEILNSRQATTLISAFGTVNKSTAGEMTEQFNRLTMGGSTKDSFGRVIPTPGEDRESLAAYEKSLGITEKMDPIQRGKLMVADFNEAEKRAIAKGEGFNPIGYAKTKGMMNEGERNALLGFRGLMNNGVYGGLEAMANDPNLGKDTTENAEAKLATEPLFQDRMSKAALDAANMSHGMTEEGLMQPMRRAALARLRLKDKSLPKDLEQIDTASMFSPTEALYGRKKQVDRETQDMLMEAARQRGIPFNSVMEANSPTGIISGRDFSKPYREAIGQDEQYRLVRELGKQGFNITGDAMNKVVDAMEKSARASGLIIDRFGQAPAMDGRPAQPAAAPGVSSSSSW